MKKLLSIYIFLILNTVVSNAGSSYDEVGYMTFKYGLSDISDDLSFNQHSFALDLIGEMGNQIKPKLDLSYVSIDETGGVDYLFQTSINAFFKSQYGYQNIIPYIYGGLGYEYVGGKRKGFDSSFYIQEGLGVEIPISQPSDDLHIVTELRFMQLIGSGNGEDSEMSIFLGLRLPIGKTFTNYPSASVTQTYAELQEEIPEPKIKEPITIKVKPKPKHDLFADEDGDGVADSIDICPNTPKEVAVNRSGCPIRDDRLYVEKPKKIVYKTQKSASSFKSLPTTRKILDIHFKLNSDQIEKASRDTIRKFVEAVNRTSFSKIIVEGYTDSTGSYKQNLELSKRRAESVKNLMVQYGVDPTRIKAIGKGPVSPIATNETEIGRAQNRRIEIVVE